MASLLLIVDSDEQTPIGVFPNWREAYAHAYFEAFDPNGNSGNPETPDPEQVREFESRFAEEFEVYERMPDEYGMDMQWSAVVVSCDYRIVHVPVFGRVER